MLFRVCFISLILLLPACGNLFAGKQIDSLKQRIKIEKNDTSIINLHNKIAELYNYNDPGNMIMHAETAHKLCKKINFPKGEFYALLNISTACYITGTYGKGLAKAKEALKLANRYKNEEWKSAANNALGLLYIQTKKYNEAADFFEESLAYLRTHKAGSNVLSSSLNNLANCYLYLENYKKSIQIRKEVIALRLTNNYISGLGDSYNDLGETYAKMQMPDSAIYYLDKAYEIKKDIRDDEMCAVATLNLGVVYMRLGNYSKALDYLTLANAYALKIKSLPYRLEIWKKMLEVYKSKSDKSRQLDLLYKIITLTDSIYTQENQRQINQLQIEFKTEKKELENKTLKAQNLQQKKLTEAESSRKKTILWFSIAGGSLLLVFLIIVMNRFKITRKQKQQIELKNKHLEELKDELERLSIVASETENVVLIMDEKGTLEWVNASFEKLNAITLEELKKLKGNTIFEISNNPNIRQIVDECVREKKSYQYESLNYTRDGKRYWESSTLTPIFDKNGKLRKLIIIDADITERKDAEELVREKQKEIIDSIKYASRIQKALLPGEAYLKKELGKHNRKN